MNSILNDGKNYKTYRGLPAMAGLGPISAMIRPGLTVDESVSRLKRYHYVLKRLHEIFINHLTSEPIYELKMGFSLHAYICSEHVAALRQRVGEMREPPLGLDVVPCADLQTFFDEILNTPHTDERLAGIYGKTIPALIDPWRTTSRNPTVSPIILPCVFAASPCWNSPTWSTTESRCLKVSSCLRERPKWPAGFNFWMDAWRAAEVWTEAVNRQPNHSKKLYSAKPFVFDPVPKRDERFIDPFNRGVNAEAFLYNENYPPGPKVLMMFYKRLREIDVPEMMASILVETKGKPWDYYRDMTRQLWDEARHAMMGEVGFVSQGLDWTKIPVTITWSRSLNTQLTALERHGVLYYIEQGLMPKTGKRFEWEIGGASQNSLAQAIQDYDWADEVLHARIGRTWYVSQFPSPKEAIEYGDRCWSKVLMDWDASRREGLTDHRNWWPDIYTQACANAGLKPDPKVLAFNINYEGQRPDLRDISA